jgi:hypothetical protein
MAARLGLTNEVLKCFDQYVRGVQEFPCGMAGTPGNVPKSWGGQIGDSPGFDASGVLAAAVAEMQLQSYGGVIRVFPAWPGGWRSEFSLMAENGFLVSSQIGAAGEIPEIRIQSTLGGQCEVIVPWPGGASLSCPWGDQRVVEGQRAIFQTKAGDVCSLIPASKVAVLDAIRVRRNEGPRWPFHRGAEDTIEAYMKRTDSFGMLGIARDGQNLTRNKVRKALAEQAKEK